MTFIYCKHDRLYQIQLVEVSIYLTSSPSLIDIFWVLWLINSYPTIMLTSFFQVDRIHQCPWPPRIKTAFPGLLCVAM